MVGLLMIFSRGIGSQRPWSAVGSGYGIFPKASGVCPVLLTTWPLLARTRLHRHRVTARHGRASSAVSQHSSGWWAPLDTQRHNRRPRSLRRSRFWHYHQGGPPQHGVLLVPRQRWRSALIRRPRTVQRSVHGSLPASVSDREKVDAIGIFAESEESDFRGCTLLRVCHLPSRDPESKRCDYNDLRTS
jgi:hypothetical protein